MSLLSQFFGPRLPAAGVRYPINATCLDVDVTPLGTTDGQANCDFSAALSALGAPKNSLIAAQLTLVSNESVDSSPITPIVKQQLARVLTDAAGNLADVTGGNDGWIVPGAAYSGGFSWIVQPNSKVAVLTYDPGLDPTIFLGGRLRLCLGPVTPILV